MDDNNGLLSSKIRIKTDKIKSGVKFVVEASSIIFVICCFFTYVTVTEFFDYWGIDKSLFVIDRSNLINKYLLSFCILCFVVIIFLFLEKNISSNNLSKKEKYKNLILGSIIWLGCSCIINSNRLYDDSIINYLVSQIYGLVIYFILIFLFVKKDGLKKGLNKITNYIREFENEKFSDKILDVIVVIIALFLGFKIIGIFESWVKKDYQIIETNQPNECSVVLYSTKDYFVVSECKMDEEKNKLTIYKGKVKKIDNKGVITNKRIFSEIEKK